MLRIRALPFAFGGKSTSFAIRYPYVVFPSREH